MNKVNGSFTIFLLMYYYEIKVSCVNNLFFVASWNSHVDIIISVGVFQTCSFHFFIKKGVNTSCKVKVFDSKIA